ncbi:glycosyltransferase [Arsenicicoccus bolidensis]|uniref:glycosyltransferase n=1 Tax=Arsenicicoccus bolidensis TaxID=229480 RepID=UPI0028B0A621|nr:glycosyltransferase [Arsenicicoccus bolidensis]
MYATLPEMQARVKFKVFSLTKGQLYRIVNRHADEVFAYTPHTVQRLKKFAGPKGIRLLPLAFDETEFYPSSQLRRAVREEQGWEHNEFVIVAPGKVQVQKRFGTLVGSINRLAQDGKKVRLLLVGLDDGDASMALRKQISTEQLDGMITAIPFANHARLNALFNAADLGTWPAMPAITIQQAMGTGLRVLIPDNDFVQHLVRDANTGRLFNPDMELGEQLVSLLGREYDDRLAHAGDRRRMARASGNEWLSTANLARRLTASDGVGT